MTWPWYHNAGQTVTYLKNSQKTRQAAPAQPVWPSLTVHVVLFSSLLSYSNLFFFPHPFQFCVNSKNSNICALFPLNVLYFDTEKLISSVAPLFSFFFLLLFFLTLDVCLSVYVTVFITVPLSLSVVFLNMSGLSALQQPAVSSGASQGITKLLV